MRRLLALGMILCAAARAHADEPPAEQAAENQPGSGYAASARVRRLPLQGVTTLDAETARAHPAALGEPARALLDSPGVARSSFAGSELVLWGAAGNETRVYVDGVEIPSLFHSAGFRTTVHPVLIDTVNLTPGAAGARYGRGLGGVVELDTKRPAPGAHVGAAVDAIDASLQAQLAGKHGAVLLGLRYGYLDRVVNALAPKTSDVLAVPAHVDGALKLVLRVDRSTELVLTWLGSGERVEVARADSQQRRDLTFHVLSLKLERRYLDGARMHVTPFVGFSDRRERSVFSQIPLTQRERGINFGLRADYTRSITWLTVSIGLDVKGAHDAHERHGTLTLPAREGDVSLFGQVPVDAQADDSWRTTLLNAAPHLTLSLRLDKLTLEPGMRLENMLISASRSVPTPATIPAIGVDRFYTFLEPRLRVAYRIARSVTAEARTGIYHQAPSGADLSAIFGSPTLRPARAIHVTAGPRISLARAFVIECVGYYRYLTELAVRSDRQPPDLSAALLAKGSGQSYGASLSLQGEPTRGLSLITSYTLGRSTRREGKGSERLFDRDQTHLLSVITAYVARHWSTSLGLRATSGSPRTRVKDSYLDVTSARQEPLFGAHNGARLPFYFQINAHVEYRLPTDPVELALSFDVLNLTNHTNVEQVAYDPTFSRRRDVTGLPVLAMLGLRVGY